MDESYLPVDIQTLKYDNEQAFDVFFNASNEKMVLYCAKGRIVNEEVRESIKKHDIRKLYILKKDKLNYDRYIEKNLRRILKDIHISHTDKAKTSYNTIKNIAQTLFEDPKAYIIKRYKKVIFDTMDHVFSDDEFFKDLLNMTTFDFTVYNHSINVGIFSIGLTKEILMDKEPYELGEIAAGFFLHDIGKCKIPINILNKKGKLSPAEWEIIKKHPWEGVKLLDELGTQTEETAIIVYQHHERYDGKGYPEGLKGDDIHVYAKICSIADAFDGMTSYRPHRKPYTTFNALKIMKDEMFKHFDPEYFQKFVKLFTYNK